MAYPSSMCAAKKTCQTPLQKWIFLDEYINMALLEGNIFAIEVAAISIYLSSFIVGNLQAEFKIQVLPEADKRNGRIAFMMLREYEDICLYANKISNADHILKSLFHSGKNPSHMHWTKFECHLNGAFAALGKQEDKEVYSNRIKQRSLMSKVKDPNLEIQK